MMEGNTNQFIGSKISLISKSEIRYEGILYSLDLQEATISLAKVRSFGTEDRVTARYVPPKDEIYEFIIFRGSDIKGIDVIEPPKNEPEKDESLATDDPAILQVQQFPQGHGQGPMRSLQHQAEQQGGQSSSEKVQQRVVEAHPQQQQQQQQQNHHNSQQQQNAEGDGYNNGRGGYQSRGRGGRGGQGQGGRGRGGRGGVYRGGKKLQFEGEFDFEKANEELQSQLLKIKVTAEEEEETEEGDEHTFYQKDNFFDSISCEALERQKGKSSRPDWRAERKLNAETFGIQQQYYGNNGRGYYPRGGYYNNYRGYRGYQRGYQGHQGQRGYQRGYLPNRVYTRKPTQQTNNENV